MTGIFVDSELRALAREPRRNKEVILNKVRNVLEPVRSLMTATLHNRSPKMGIQELSQHREQREKLERQLTEQLTQLSVKFQTKIAEVNELFRKDATRHPDLDHPMINFEDYLTQGWTLDAGQIPFQQMDAAVHNAKQQQPIFNEDGSSTQQSISSINPKIVEDELSGYGEQRDTVFSLGYHPATELRNSIRMNFFSAQTGSQFQENGTADEHSTTAKMGLDKDGNLTNFDLNLIQSTVPYRKSTLRTPIPELHFRKDNSGNLIIEYINLVSNNESKVIALEQALLKINWMIYAMDNIGQEYYARANLNSMLQSRNKFVGSIQTAGSVMIDADHQALQSKLKKPDKPADLPKPFSF